MTEQSRVNSKLWTLAAIWLALHAALLAVVLGAKFIGFKLMLVALLLMSTVWFVARQPARLALARRRVV